jgi:hypothetical protein
MKVVKSRTIRRAGHVARVREKKNSYRMPMGKPEGKRPPGRHTRRWEDNIKIDLRETGWDRMKWIDLAHDSDQLGVLENTIMNLRTP